MTSEHPKFGALTGKSLGRLEAGHLGQGLEASETGDATESGPPVGFSDPGTIQRTAGQSQPLIDAPDYEEIAGWDSQEIPPGS